MRTHGARPSRAYMRSRGVGESLDARQGLPDRNVHPADAKRASTRPEASRASGLGTRACAVPDSSLITTTGESESAEGIPFRRSRMLSTRKRGIDLSSTPPTGARLKAALKTDRASNTSHASLARDDPRL